MSSALPDQQAVLADIPGFAGAMITEQLAAGITGTSWLVEQNSKRYVLRLRSADAAKFVPDAFAEHIYSKLAHSAGLAPKPLFVSSDGTISLREYQSGVVWQAFQLEQQDLLAKLADALARLHRIPVPAGEWSSTDQAERHFLRYAALVGEPGQPLLEAGMSALQEIGRLDPDVAVCHGDVVCSNLIHHNGEVRFIDWEYACVLDPCFDLASLIVEQNIEEPTIERLLSEYRQASGRVNGHRLGLWVDCYKSLQALWLLALGQSA